MRRTLVIALTAVAAVSSAQWKPYYDGYGDFYWNKLTGSSSLQTLRYGFKNGGPDMKKPDNDFHIFIRNETYDTNGTDLPFQYSARGTVAGLGYRYWFPGRQFYATVTAGTGIAGSNIRRSDLRAGLAGFTEWWKDKDAVTDLYADLFYVDRAKDTFLNVRVRPGYVLRQNKDGRIWAYGLGQLYASGTGKNGTENRIEGGVGIGYIFGGRFTINAEARQGYSFRGQITKKSYFNPTIYIAGNL